MRIAAEHRKDMAERFESALDYIPRLDPIPFHRKREAAEAAAQVAWEYLQENSK